MTKFKEYIPVGFSSWAVYNRHRELVDRVKYWASGIGGALLLLGGYALNSYIDLLWG